MQLQYQLAGPAQVRQWLNRQKYRKWGQVHGFVPALSR